MNDQQLNDLKTEIALIKRDAENSTKETATLLKRMDSVDKQIEKLKQNDIDNKFDMQEIINLLKHKNGFREFIKLATPYFLVLLTWALTYYTKVKP